MNNEMTKKDLDWFIDKVTKFVAIESYYQEDDSKYPFGKNVQKALEFIIGEYKKLGIKTYIDPDGYYGYAEIGDSKELFGILGHVDVVPVGDTRDWEIENPFKVQVKNNILYGRGVIDDKGPIISMLLAVKKHLEQGHKFKKRIRFIFGGDEESLWRGIQKYVQKEETPSLAFVTDEDFPLVYAEKGLVNYWLKSNAENDFELISGDAFNSVIDSAKYNGSKQKELEVELQKQNFEYTKTEDSIIVLGKKAHAKQPSQGVNATIRLFKCLYNIGQHSPMIDFIIEKISEDENAFNIFKGLEDEPTGKITLNIGKINVKENHWEAAIDIRFPVVNCDKDKVEKLMEEAIKDYDISMEEYDYLRPVYMSKEHPLVKKLYNIYKEVTNKDEEMVSTGGATYARAMENCVSFGPKFPNTTTNEHAPNEQFDVQSIKDAVNIYYRTLIKIDE